MADINQKDIPKVSANDLAKKTSLLDVLHLLTMFWSNVSKSAVQNCFRRGSFLNESMENEEVFDIQLQPDDMTETEFLVQVAIDDTIEVADKLTEEDFWKMITSESLIEEPCG